MIWLLIFFVAYVAVWLIAFWLARWLKPRGGWKE